jgi:hypothetical protein
MEKYNLNEGNESLKRVLLMMGYDNNKTLAENTKNIFEQDMDNDVDPKLTNSLVQPVTTTTPPEAGTPPPATGAPETPETTPLSYKDLVIKLQNLLLTNYKSDLGKYGADGKIGTLTLTALNNAIKTKASQSVNEPSNEVKVDDKKTEIITPDNQLKPDNSVAVNPGSIDDWA